MKPSPCSAGIAPAVLALLAAGLFTCPVALPAGDKDVDVISVTDVTPEGRAIASATPDQPVYYQMLYRGETEFGRSWLGETKPSKQEIINWMIAALRAQGYLLADARHPPTQLLAVRWGLMSGGSARPALGFLGGEKANLMWEQNKYGRGTDMRVLARGIIRTGIAGQVWDIAESDLYMGAVQSYSIEPKDGPKPKLYWETRFACPAPGHTLTKAMPLLIAAAALNFGRETAKPVALNASQAFGGNVTLGEFKVLGTENKLPSPGSKSDKPGSSPE